GEVWRCGQAFNVPATSLAQQPQNSEDDELWLGVFSFLLFKPSTRGFIQRPRRSRPARSEPMRSFIGCTSPSDLPTVPPHRLVRSPLNRLIRLVLGGESFLGR